MYAFATDAIGQCLLKHIPFTNLLKRSKHIIEYLVSECTYMLEQMMFMVGYLTLTLTTKVYRNELLCQDSDPLRVVTV